MTGGRHLDAFTVLCRDIIVESGIPEAHVYSRVKRELPGYYRAKKNWDLVVTMNDCLVAVIEFKAQVGPSFGNSCNNRTEEALGNAIDLWAAYREGALAPSPRPWLGYIFILEDCPQSRRPVAVKEPHFPIFDEFRAASYVNRHQILLTNMLRDRLNDGVGLLSTNKHEGLKGKLTFLLQN